MVFLCSISQRVGQLGLQSFPVVCALEHVAWSICDFNFLKSEWGAAVILLGYLKNLAPWLTKRKKCPSQQFYYCYSTKPFLILCAIFIYLYWEHMHWNARRWIFSFILSAIQRNQSQDNSCCWFQSFQRHNVYTHSCMHLIGFCVSCRAGDY